MNYKITTLVENCVYGRKLQAEHGLSLYIETAEHKLLFDTGASDLFISNARLLHIDLREVDYLILSHGHSDHTGGLRHFLELNTLQQLCASVAFSYLNLRMIVKMELSIPKRSTYPVFALLTNGRNCFRELSCFPR